MLSSARSKDNEAIFNVVLQEATTIIFLMLREAAILQGACDDNESRIARREDATIKFLYAVNHKDDGNECIFLHVLQGATKTILSLLCHKKRH